MKFLASTLASCILLVAWCQTGSLMQQAASRAEVLANPLENSQTALRAGAKLYERECAACHGRNRQGRGKVPPLNQAEVCQAASGVLFWILRNGSLHRGMPSFAHLPEAQRWQIITFLRQAATSDGFASKTKPAAH